MIFVYNVFYLIFSSIVIRNPRIDFFYDKWKPNSLLIIVIKI